MFHFQTTGSAGAIRYNRQGMGGQIVHLSRKAGTVTPLRPSEAGRVVRCKDVAASVESDPNAAWVHLALYGEWKGHPSGEFTFDDAAFSQIAHNFARNETPTAVKYEHPNYLFATGPVPSAGKIHDLRIDDNGLWGLTLFTERAAQHIRAKEYEFCSVVIAFDSKDRITGDPIGAELLELGLTDSPFVDNQTPITLPELAQAA